LKAIIKLHPEEKMDKTPEDLYREREKRVLDAIALRKPDRVPVVALLGSFPARHAGITFEEEMNDREKCFEAHYRAISITRPTSRTRCFFLALSWVLSTSNNCYGRVTVFLPMGATNLSKGNI
jgi:hypothetical protein